MAYNFKSIADAEVVETPADTANVLIEENGLIKKAPKTAVGGGVDMVIDVTEDFLSATGSAPIVTRNIVKGSYNEIKEKILAKEPFSVVITWYRINSETSKYRRVIHVVDSCLNEVDDGNDELIEFTYYCNGSICYLAIAPDGTFR